MRITEANILRIERESPGFFAEYSAGWHFLDAVCSLHEELRPGFEAKIWDSGPSFSALAAAQLTTFSVAQVRPIELLDRSGHTLQATGLSRAVEENITNLFYILYAGPRTERRTAEDLAEQFLAYRDIEHLRIIKKWKKGYEDDYRNGLTPTSGPKSLSEFQLFCGEVEARGQATRSRFPKMTGNSWHQLNKEDMRARVLTHLPPYAAHLLDLWEITAKGTAMGNHILHASPMLFQLEQTKLIRGQVMALPASVNEDLLESHASYGVAMFAYVCWLALGDLLWDRGLVESTFAATQKRILNSMAERLRVPKMIRID